jgi:hypothetical protein
VSEESVKLPRREWEKKNRKKKEVSGALLLVSDELYSILSC